MPRIGHASTVKKYKTEKRRERVASFLLFGLTHYEIALKLHKMGDFNEETNEPWSITVISADCKKIKERWISYQMGCHAELVADHLRQLAEIKKIALTERNKDGERAELKLFIKALEREAKMLGIDAPSKSEVTNHDSETAKKDLQTMAANILGEILEEENSLQTISNLEITEPEISEPEIKNDN